MAKKINVLIADNNVEDIQKAEEELKRFPKDVVIKKAPFNKNFINTVKKSNADAIICECRNGSVNLLNLLRDTKNTLNDIPLLILTSPDKEPLALKCLKAGVADYVLKDNIKRLGFAVFQLIEKKNLETKYRHLKSKLTPKASSAEKSKETFFLNENLLNALLNNFPGNIYFKDKKSKIIKTSLYMAGLFNGNSCEHLQGKNDFDLFDEIHANEAFRQEQQIIKTKKPIIDIVEKEVYPDGVIRYASTTKMPLYDQHHKIIGTFGLSRDITAQIEAEAKLARYTRELKKKTATIQLMNRELEQKINERTAELSAGKSELEKTNTELQKARKAALSIMQDEEKQRKKAEKALQSIRTYALELKKLSLAIEVSPVSIVVTNHMGIIEYVNQYNSKSSGYSSEEIIGQKTSILKSGYHTQNFYKKLWSTITSGNVWSGEILNKSKDGTLYWERTSIAPITDDQYNITHFIAVKEDITEKKKADEEIKYLNNFQSILTQISSRFINLDFDYTDNQIKKALEEIAHFTKVDSSYVFMFSQNKLNVSLTHKWSSAKSLSSEKMLENLVVDLKSFWIKKILKGEIIDFTNTNGMGLEEIFLQRLFPAQQIKSIIAVPMIDNRETIGFLGLHTSLAQREWKEDEKNLLKLVGSIFTNALKRKQSQDELLREKTFTETLLQSLPGIFYAISPEGKFIRWNENYKNLIGLPEDELRELNPFSRVFKKDLEPAHKAFRKSLEGGTITLEARLINSLGKPIPHLLTGTKVQMGDSDLVIGVGFDISERLKMEEELKKAKDLAEAATQAKSRFLAVISHEIRTPMNAIIGFSNLTLKTELSRKQLDYLNKIESSAHTLLGIIDDILDFSKIEAGALRIDSVPFSLNSILRKVANFINLKAQEKNLEVIFKTNPDVPLGLIGDPLRLEQVLLNLISNAIKFTEKGEIVVHTELLQQVENNAVIHISVIDTGVGFDKDIIPKLFAPFVQADASISRVYGGTGLGLSISRHLVNLMGGDINAESESGKGSTFSFTVFLGIHKNVKREFELPSSSLKGLNVLVVDDNKSVRETLADYLKSFSFKPKTTDTAEKALKELHKQNYDLILINWKMSRTDGINAAIQIKSNPAFQKIPIILMVSGFNRELAARSIAGSGIDGFLIKPVTASLLFDTIMEVLGYDMHKLDKVLNNNKLMTGKIDTIRGARILLVEDNEVNQQVASEFLESEGFWVYIADNGREALRKINEGRDNPFDLVLLDIQMPVMDGYEAAEEIRKDKRFASMPIIAMSADAVVGVKQKCLDAGMNDFISKPIIHDDFFNMLARWIKPADREINYNSGFEKQKPQQSKSTDYPVIRYLDTKKGINRVNGNSEAYLRIVLKFRNNYSRFLSDFKNHLKNKRFDKAQTLIHSIKGVAGNISADSLYKGAVELERVLKQENPENFQDALYGFEEEFKNLLKSITQYEKKHLIKTQLPVAENEFMEYPLAGGLNDHNPLLQELKLLLKENNMRAKELLETLQNYKQTKELKELLGNIAGALESYNFKLATDYLNLFFDKNKL
jgi:PAS domain S-box-containing protein